MDAYGLWFDAHIKQIQKDYFEFLRFPSISAQIGYRDDCLKTAAWLRDYLHQGGFVARLIETQGLPLVYAENLNAGKDAPTLLIYGHYDVQPVDPLELWKSPPFEPTERDGSIYARGAVDDKGQIFYTLLALLSWKKEHGSLPVNLKICIEGEEESHSAGFFGVLPQLGDVLKADYLLVPDFDQVDSDTPAISLGARGMAALELELKGSLEDLHSGIYGGIAYNPNRALVELLGKLWDEQGKVTVPGFYEFVKEPTPSERESFFFPHEASFYQSVCGIYQLGGETERSLQERNWFRPTLEIHGLLGGYTGIGMKTVIPASASAKLTSRLVPGQDPAAITHALVNFFKQNTPPGMHLHIKTYPGAEAFRGQIDSLLVRAVSFGIKATTGKEPCKLLSGASIPVIAELMKVAQADVVGMGVGLSDDRIHAPNERFDMKRFKEGFCIVSGMLAYFKKGIDTKASF